MVLLAADTVTLADYIPVIVQVLATAGVIFGGAGYWQYRQAKEQAKRDAQSKENGVEKKVDTLIENVTTLNETVSQLNTDIKDVKDDILLLQEANEATVKYREFRDQQDKKAAKVQEAIIQSLMGILRERLLENYNKCQEKGYYTKEEREVYSKMYECYTQDPFNGNGVIHQLQPVMEKMPWTEEEAKKIKNKKNIA